MSTFLDALLAGLKRTANDFLSFAHKPTPVGADVVLLEDSTAGGAKKYSTLTELGVGGAGLQRDPQFWAGSSFADGTPNGDPDTLGVPGPFVSELGRITPWGGGACTSDLPAVGPGDHNKVVGYREGSGTNGGTLTLSAQGTTKINAGDSALNATSVVLEGAGMLHLFRYDETIDKWILVLGVPFQFRDVKRDVIIGPVIDIEIGDGEMARVDASGGAVVLHVPSSPYRGQTFAVRRLDAIGGNTLTLDGTAGPWGIEDPATPGSYSVTITIPPNSGYRWYWDEYVVNWLVKHDS